MQEAHIKKLLLLGFGDLSQRLADELASQPINIFAVRRSKPEAVQAQNVRSLQADITHQQQLLKLIVTVDPDDILLCITPDVYTDAGYKDSYLAAAKNLADVLELAVLGNLLQKMPPVVYVSSTRVMPENAGAWVDEETVIDEQTLQKKDSKGHILWQAEQQILSLNQNKSDVTATIIRCSGIYGRRPAPVISEALGIKVSHPEQKKAQAWSNRVHVDDVVSIFKHVILLPQSERHDLYIATDSEPSLKRDILSWVLGQLPSTFNEDSEKAAFYPVSCNDALSGKRCSNKRLINSEYEFICPSFREGLLPQLQKARLSKP